MLLLCAVAIAIQNKAELSPEAIVRALDALPLSEFNVVSTEERGEKYRAKLSKELIRLNRCSEPTLRRVCEMLEERGDVRGDMSILPEALTCQLWFLLRYRPRPVKGESERELYFKYHFHTVPPDNRELLYDWPWIYENGQWQIRAFDVRLGGGIIGPVSLYRRFAKLPRRKDVDQYPANPLIPRFATKKYLPVAKFFPNDYIGGRYVESRLISRKVDSVTYGGTVSSVSSSIGPAEVHVSPDRASRIRLELIRDPHFVGSVIDGSLLLKPASGGAWRKVVIPQSKASPSEKPLIGIVRKALFGTDKPNQIVWIRTRRLRWDKPAPIGYDLVAPTQGSGALEYWHTQIVDGFAFEWRTLPASTLRQMNLKVPIVEPNVQKGDSPYLHAGLHRSQVKPSTRRSFYGG